MTMLDMGALGLASWRLASLLVQEAGPYGVTEWFRERLGIRHEDGIPSSWPGAGLAALFSCVWCMSVWTAGLLYLVWRFTPIPVYILAASALAVGLQAVIERLRPE